MTGYQCRGATERSRIRNTRTSVTFDDIADLRWKCGSCEEWHAGPCLDFGCDAPYCWREEHKRATNEAESLGSVGNRPKTFLDEDFCAIEDHDFFVCGIIYLPIIGTSETLRWGVWASLSRDNFQTLMEMRGPLVGPDGRPAFGMGVCHCEPSAGGEESLKAIRRLGAPLADTIALRPYVEMQTIFDQAWPPGRHYYNKAHNIRRLGVGAISTILRYSAELPTALSNIAFQQLHGAASRVPSGETAFPHRYDHFDLLVHPAADDASDCEKMISWARECWESLRPFVERAVYVNALEDAVEEGERRVREAYGTNYEKLVALKRRFDPANFFRLNTNIKPSKNCPS